MEWKSSTEFACALLVRRMLQQNGYHFRIHVVIVLDSISCCPNYVLLTTVYCILIIGILGGFAVVVAVLIAIANGAPA